MLADCVRVHGLEEEAEDSIDSYVYGSRLCAGQL